MNDRLAALPRRVVAAGLLVTDGEGRVLVVKPTYKPGWEIPGGVVEAGETPPDAAEREGREELGVAAPAGRLLVVEHQVKPDPKGDSVMLVYDGGSLRGPFALPPDELSEARYVPVADLPAYLPERQARRLAAAVAAREAGTVVELCDGVPREAPY